MMVPRVSTGIRTLDQILGGGIPAGSLVVVAGAPGSGKTILAQQMCFSSATPERKAIYYTTLSEPHTKMIRHLRAFTFYDDTLLGKSVELYHLSPEPGAEGFHGTIEEIVRTVFEVQPGIIVIDSAKVLHESVDEETFRRGIYELAGKLSHADTMLVLVGEYDAADMAHLSEFAVADSILHLVNQAQGLHESRWLRVLKLRGSDYLGGRHAFRITASGFDVWPRFESIVAPGSERRANGRVSVGVQGLDAMLGGGLPTQSATLVSGPSGVGKTVLGLHFIQDGLARGEPCLFISFQETRGQLQAKAAAFGWDFAAAERAGTLSILYEHPIELELDEVGARIRETVDRMGARRVVVDSMSELRKAGNDDRRVVDYIWALVEILRSSGATSLVTNETEAFFGPAFELAGGMSHIFDNIVLLRYTELESAIHRALTVVKMRESDHVKTLVEFVIDKKGLAVKGSYAGFAGVLSGTPVATEQRFKEFFER